MMVYLSTAAAAKLALYSAMPLNGVTQSELAPRLGCHRQHVARIDDPAHNTKFEALEAALAAVGKRAAPPIEDAAELTMAITPSYSCGHLHNKPTLSKVRRKPIVSQKVTSFLTFSTTSKIVLAIQKFSQYPSFAEKVRIPTPNP